MDIQAIGRVLAEARRAGRKLSEYPGPQPADMAQALAIQDAMATAMGQPVVGWKVGLTSALAQQVCGVDAPLAGPVFADTLLDSPARLALTRDDLGIIEAEIGFRMKSDLPPRAAPYTRGQVLAEAGEVLPVFEWVNKRLPGGLREAAEWLAADGVINRAVICGAGRAYDPSMDLAGETVTVRQGGAEVATGVGSAALGDPAAVLVWLANDLSTRGKGLRAGDVVATGLIADLVHATPGASVTATFSTIGTVSLSVD